MEVDMPYSYSVRVPCPSEHAEVVKQTLLVDKELSPTQISREIIVDGDAIVVNYEAATLRYLRVAVHSCLQMMALSLEAVC